MKKILKTSSSPLKILSKSLGCIIPETCEAIIKVKQEEYLIYFFIESLFIGFFEAFFVLVYFIGHCKMASL